MAHKSLIFLILFLALFGGGIVSLGAPGGFSFFDEFLLLIFFVFSLLARASKGLPIPHLWHIPFSFSVIALFSIYVNDYPVTRSIFSLRLIFRFYIFYLAIILMRPDDHLIKSLNWFLVFLLVMQFPVVAYKFSQYGIAERTHGAYAVHEGSIATTLPISLIFFLAAFYFLYKPKILYVLIGFGYICLSIVGAKRAVFFLYPLQFIAIYFYIYVKETRKHITKKIGVLMVVIPLIISLSGSILYFTKSLNPDDRVGGQIDFAYALRYGLWYSYGIDTEGYSFGRVATTLRIVEILSESGLPQVIFGMGPGVMTSSLLDSKQERENFERKYDSFKIGYGVTTITHIAMEYGFVGVMVFTIMLLSLTRLCFKLFKEERDPYWRAFACGSLWFSLSMFFFAFTYHHTTFLGDTMPVLYFYAMAVVYTRYYHRPLPNKGQKLCNI